MPIINDSLGKSTKGGCDKAGKQQSNKRKEMHGLMAGVNCILAVKAVDIPSSFQ